MKALAGVSVVVTRPAAQAHGLIDRLESEGARVIACPTLEVIAASDGGAALAAAVAELDTFDWVVVTSVNAVEWFLRSLDGDAVLARRRIAAIGPATAAAFENAGVTVDLVPEAAVAESLLDALCHTSTQARALLPRAEVARDTLPAGLTDAGWEVTDVAAYRTVTPDLEVDQIEEASRADVITFTSPSTFERFLVAAGPDAVPPVIATIGPVTSKAIRDAGRTVTVEAAIHTTDGLVDALVAWGSAMRQR